ncbi:CBS domain-containing protein [Halalkalibacillus sediminis]|uniref:CBS domain-containing protein n=1 Tax=Halalkalibacillus sediminis TaxID=2018042 RepID=A0A2I0QVU4_9BACI|nr:cyclic-di-AMP-binding protein CbpB [Halalkalibacillus sediminis]PKR78465.1 CBS domain-containing protein [Halalkalibacillus sediminis]
MLSTKDFDLETTTVQEMMIDADKVAHVQLQNPLEHALLVLAKTGYNAVPVLDLNSRFCGIISKSNIIEAMFGVERIEVEQLNEKIVKDAMDQDIPTLHEEDTLEKALHVLIDYTFVCVIDQQQQMTGILTRRQMLKQFRNQYYQQRGN